MGSRWTGDGDVATEYEQFRGLDALGAVPLMLEYRIDAMGEREAHSLFHEAVGEIPKDMGDLRQMLKELAEDFDNYDEPSANFKERAGRIMWDVMVWMKDATS